MNSKKRLKRLHSMDPLLLLPYELHELIFQHLSENDVINASEVSRLWNQETLNSKECAKMFKINIHNIFELPKKDDLKQLQTSLRKYQNIHIRWDYLEIDNTECWNLIQAQAQSIETLSIANLMLVNDSETNLLIPKLKNLTISHQTNWLFNPTYHLLKPNNNLTSLILDVDFDDRICEFFMQNQTLKELQLSSNLILNLLLSNALNDVKFKLTKLKISRTIFSFMDNNFHRFLMSQANSLEVIEVFGVPTEVFNMIFNDFKVIRDFNVRRVYNFYYINVNPNNTIRTFTSDLPLEGLAPIIIAATNLEVLKVHILRTEMMEFVARNARSLRKLLFETRTGDVLRCYKNLKTLTTDINRNIELSELY
ncbi:unnamed protein product [Diamesa serratosioi]